MTGFVDLEQYAGRVAIVDHGRLITYRELRSLADAAVSALPPRSLVFVECANTLAAVSAYLGCLRAGHVVHLFADLNEPRLDALVTAYRPNAIIRASGATSALSRCHDEPLALHPELAVLLSTSGSTGSPKFVKLSLANIDSNAKAIADYLKISMDDRAITSVKFSYSYGMSVINSQFAAGAAVVLTDESISAPAFWEAFVQGGATSFAGVPYSFEMLMQNKSWARTPGLRTVTQAGGKLDPAIARHVGALGVEHGWNFYIMYGQTEAAPRIAYLPPDQLATHPDCIGRAIPGGTLSLVDDDGEPVTAEDVAGQLRYAGPNVMMGYASDLSGLATDETPELLLTGDIAVRTGGGLYRIVGRIARLVKPFGVRVDLDALETMVRQQLPDALCAGNDDHIVVATTGAIPNGFANDLAKSLGVPPFMLDLRQIEQIPHLPNGKVDYQTLLRKPVARPAISKSSRHRIGGVFSGAFLHRFAQEVTNIVGVSSTQWTSVRQIYASLVTRDVIDDDSSFIRISGDSLSYVQTMLALEDYLGRVPDDWEKMSVAQLEDARCLESAL